MTEYEVETVHYPFGEDTYFVMITNQGRPVGEDYIFEVNSPNKVKRAVSHATMVANQLQFQGARSAEPIAS